MAQYQRVGDWVTNAWVDNLTGEMFVDSDTAVWRRFQEWVAAGNVPDNTPKSVTTPTKVSDSRTGRIAALAAQAKQGLALPAINSPGEKAVATVLGQVLDGLAALDPLPPAPVIVTIIKTPDPVVAPPAPPSVQNAGVRPVRIQ